MRAHDRERPSRRRRQYALIAVLGKVLPREDVLLGQDHDDDRAVRRQHSKVGYRVTAQHTVMGIGHRRAAAQELDLRRFHDAREFLRIDGRGLGKSSGLTVYVQNHRVGERLTW